MRLFDELVRANGNVPFYENHKSSSRKPSLDASFTEIARRFNENLFPVIVAQNVFEYIDSFDPSGKFIEAATKAAPNVAPPFDECFIEGWFGHAAMKIKFGVLLRAVERPPDLAGSLKWTWLAYSFADMHPLALIGVDAIFVDRDGKIIGSWPTEPGAFSRETMLRYLLSTMMTISFLHSKRHVSAVEHVPDAPLVKKSFKKHGHGLTRYYTLEIDGLTDVLRREGRIEEVGLARALHICRGHFATYTPERPLFGRHTGTFWVPQHVRGMAEAGRIVKDYAVADELVAEGARP